MTTNQPESYYLKSKSINELDSWIAYDFEWIVIKNYEIFRLGKIDKNTSDASVPPVFGNEEEEHNEIVTFAFEDCDGNKGVLDTTDFPSTKSFLQAIKEKLLQYQYCIAWGSKAVIRKNIGTGQLEGINGDLAVLDSNLKANGIPSIVKYNEYSGIPFLKKDTFTATNQFLVSDIDLLLVFAKPLVKWILKNRYKGLRLDDVCKGVLGYGKLDNQTGAKLDEMSVEERKVYCLHDAHLVAELVRVNNGDVIKIMRVIASHTGLTFGEVCHKGMTGIWKKIIDKSISKKIGVIGYENISPVLRKLYSNKSHGNYVDYFNETEYDEEEEEDEELLEYKENSYDQYIELIEQKQRESGLNSQNINNNSKHDNSSNQRKNNVEIKKFESKYKGGLIISPSRGSHHDVFVFDITSLYPTLIINSNISPETVNCSCHENNSKAKLLFDKDSNLEFLYNKTDGGKYWTCPRNGLFSSKLEELTKVRIQYKKDDKSLESTTIKAIINSGYGVFGHSNFKYYDPSVAELVTALGRQTLLDMKKIAEEMNFTVLYGDTDSLFVNGVNNKDDALKFIETCKKKLNVFVTHEKTFRKLILVGKKHYIGIPYGNDKPVIKGMEGIKSDRPEFIHSAFIEMVKNVQEDKSPIPKLKQALKDLDKRQVPKERLAISLILSKNPKEYVNDCVQKRLGTQLKLKKGDTLVYYKCDKRITYIDQSGQERTKTVGESIDPNDISYAKYKEMLINTVKDVIEILGYSVEKDLLDKKKFLQGSLF